MVDNNQQQEKPQDFELIELLFGKVDSSASNAVDQSFEARYQSLVDQIQSYLHSSEKPGFFPHRFLGSFSSVLDTKLNDKLGIKKLHFHFEGARTLKIVAETESKTHVFIFTEEIEAQHSHSPQTRTRNFEFTIGEFKNVMGRDYTESDARKLQIDVIKILKDKYELVKSRPKSDKDVKSKKLYLYVKKDGVLEYVAKDIHGGAKAIQINRDELKGNDAFKNKFFDEIKQFLDKSGKDLSDDIRKELSRLTSAKGYTLKSDGEDERINIKVESKKKIVDQPIEPTVKFQEATKKLGKSVYLESYIEKLASPDKKQVQDNLKAILNYIKKIHTNLDLQDNVYGNRAREADQHGFVAGIFDNFRYRDNTKLYLEQFAGGGYADIVLLVRGPDRAVGSVPILIELKAGTEGQVNPSDALRQAEDYIKGFRPNKMRILTNAGDAIAVGLNLDNAEPFKTEVKPIKQPSSLMDEFIKLAHRWNDQQLSEKDLKQETADLLSSEYHTFPANKETKDHYYFSRDILGQSILVNNIGQDQNNVKKYIYSYNEYPLNWPQGTEYALSKSPVTTLIFVQGNEGQEKTAFIFHIRESNTREFYADKKIPVLDIPGIERVGDVIEIKMSLKKYETGLSFEELFEIEQISKYKPSSADQQFTGNFLRIPNSDGLKVKFDQAITSQHSTSLDDKDLLLGYKRLLTEIADTIYPIKDLITNEARLQAILNGLFSSYSDLKLQETSSKTVIIPEFQVGAGGRVDMVIQGIGSSPQGTKEYTPIALEFKLIDKNLNQDQLKEEVDKLTKEQNIRYAKGAALKAITDSDKMLFMGVVVNVKAKDKNSLILTSDKFVPALVVHSSIDIAKRKHLEGIQEVTQRLKDMGIQEENLSTLESATAEKDYHYWLQQHDIADIARIEYGYGTDGANTLFEVVGSPKHIANQLQQFQNSVATRGEKRPLTLIVNLDNNQQSYAAQSQEDREDRLEVLELLISEADIETKNDDDQTLFHIAAQGRRLRAVRLLVNKIESVNFEDSLYGEPNELIRAVLQRERLKSLINEKDKFGYTPLQYAAKNGNWGMVNLFLDKTAERNPGDVANKDQFSISWTTVHYTVYNGDLNLLNDIFQFLSDKETIINTKDNSGWTPLHYAVYYNASDMVKFLVNKGADISVKDKNDKTPLDLATQENYTNIAGFLKQIELDKKLLAAAQNAGLNEVKDLINQKANINAKDMSDWTPLHFAASRDKLSVVEFLFNNNANIKAKDVYGNTSLHVAVQYSSNLEIVKFLLDKGISSINATTNNGWTPLHVAIQGNKLNTVEFLLDRGADIEVRDIYNQTSLDLATRKGYLDIAGILKQVQLGKELLTAVQGVDRNKIRDLIRLGAKLEVKDNSGNTPLCMASLIGKLDIVQYLVSKGANINAKCKAGKTPLDIAAYQKLSDVVEYFKQTQLDLDKELLNAAKSGDLDKVKECIKRSAYIDTKSSNGRTSLHWAAVEGCLPGVEYLIKGVADINAKDNISRTPLHYAARNGHLDVVKYFIEEGADFEVKDKDNKTPLDLASWKKHNDVVKYLEKIKEERYKTVQRKRRHHHGDHARHHMSRRPLAIDSSNQPEIAASSAIKPSSWINDLFNWVKGSVSELLGSRATLPEEISNTVNSIPKVDTQFAKSSGSSNGTLDSKEMPKDKLESGSNSASVKPSVSEDIYDYFASGKFFRDNVDYVNANLKQAHERQMPVKFKPSGENTILEMGDHYLSQADSNGAIMLLDLLVRKVTGQKYVSTVDQPISSLEAQGYTLNIIEKFEKVLNETAIKSGISVTNLNFDPVAVQSAIVGKIRNGEFSQVSKTLYSFAKEVCPEFKQTDKFLAHLRSNLESEKEAILLQQKVEKPSKILDQQVSRKVELSKKPNTFLNGTSVVKGISNVLER